MAHGEGWHAASGCGASCGALVGAGCDAGARRGAADRRADADGRVAGTVFLDYDGTLHDCMRLYGPALRAACAWLAHEGYEPPSELSDERICRWLGWRVHDMWEAFMPGLPEPVWRRASRIVGEEMNRLLAEGRGALFPGVAEALDELVSEGFELALLSNCSQAYCERHRRAFGLDRWLSSYYCAESFPGLEKWQIYRRVAACHAKPHVMVGDRFHDLEVGARAGIPSVGCAYGYGDPTEQANAAAVVSSPADIPAAVLRLAKGVVCGDSRLSGDGESAGGVYCGVDTTADAGRPSVWESRTCK